MDNVKRISQVYSQAPWRKQLQFAILFMVVLVFCALVAGIYLSVTARSVTLGHEIQDMQDKISEAERMNADLESQLANLRSSTVMMDRARDLGFEPIETDHIRYMEVPGYVVRPPAVLASPPGSAVVASNSISPAFTESLFDWFKENVIDPAAYVLEVQP